MVVGGNYRGLFGQLKHRVPFDGISRSAIRVIRIDTSVSERPIDMPDDAVEHVGLLASCGYELLGVAAASVWFQMFASAFRVAGHLHDEYSARAPEFEKEPVQYLMDLIHDIAAHGPCIFLIDSIDQGARNLFLNLALYEHRSRPNPGRLIICGVDELAADTAEPPAALTPALPNAIAAKTAEWFALPPLDRHRIREWLGPADDAVIDALLAHVGNRQDDRGASTWNEWVNDGYVKNADGHWRLTGAQEPTERRIANVLAARLAGDAGLPANSMNVARSALGVAALGGMSFPQSVVAEVTAEFEGSSVDTVTDILDQLVPTGGADPALLTEDGYVMGPVGALWRYRFVDASLPDALGAALDLPADAVAESLLRAGQAVGFPSLFDAFFARVAIHAGNDVLARQLRDRQRFAARHGALLEEAHVVVLTADLIAHDPERAVSLAFELLLLGEGALALRVARIAHQIAERSDDWTRANANRTLALCLQDSEPHSAEHHFNAATSIYTAGHDRNPADTSWTRGLAIALREWAGVVRDRDAGEAEELYRRSVDLHERLWRADATNLTWTRDLAIALKELAWVVRDRDAGEAEELCRRSVDLHERLWRADATNLTWTRDLAIALREWAGVVRDRDAGEAEELYRRSVDLHERLWRADATNLTWTRGLAIALAALAWVVRDRDAGEAEELYRRAAELMGGS